MWYESPIYFFIVTALFVAGRAFDIYSSQKTAWYYGLEESNKLWRDKDGEFQPIKNIIASAVYIGISVLIGVISHSWGAACALLVVGGPASLAMGYFNFSKAKKNRAKQIAFCDIIRNGGTFQAVYITRNHKTFVDLFHWLYAPEGDFQGAFDKVAEFARSGAAFPG